MTCRIDHIVQGNMQRKTLEPKSILIVHTKKVRYFHVVGRYARQG